MGLSDIQRTEGSQVTDKYKYYYYLKAEEIIWRWRSKALWLKEGDSNTKPFTEWSQSG